MPSSRRVGCLLLYLFFHIAGVFGRGGGKGGEEGEEGTIADGIGAGSDLNDAGSSLGLDSELSAVFAITIIVAIITALQFIRSLARFKRLPIPEGEPALPYDVGVLYRVFLAAYTAIYTVNNSLYAVFIASFGDTITLQLPAFDIGVAFTGQLSLVLFYATFLTIIAYRQRIQLNRQENLFNLKSLLDSLILATILFLGVADDIMAGTPRSFESGIAINNITLAFQVFSLLASLDVAISSVIARDRLFNAGIQDKIISTCAFVVSPIILIGGIYGVIEAGIERNADQSTFNFDALLIATVIIEGVVSIAAVAFGLGMGVPPKNSQVTHEGAVGKQAQALPNA